MARRGEQSQPGHQENKPVSGARQQEQLCVCPAGTVNVLPEEVRKGNLCTQMTAAALT